MRRDRLATTNQVQQSKNNNPNEKKEPIMADFNPTTENAAANNAGTITLRENFKTVGKVVGKEDLRDYSKSKTRAPKGASGKEVMNFTVVTTEFEELEGIRFPVEKTHRVTIFHQLAVEMANKLEVGDHVFLGDCSEQLREWTKDTGETKMMPNLVANQVAKIPEVVFTQIAAKLAAAMPDGSEAANELG